MSKSHLSQLLVIGELALDLHNAKNAVRNAKHAYHDDIREYEEENGRDYEHLDPDDEQQAGVFAYCKDAFDAYKARKRFAFNIQRRLDNACRKLAVHGLNGGAA